MKIWFLSIFENTPLDDNKNTRYNSLVEEATRRGHQVVYWASTFRHNVKKQRYDGYHVEQINDQVEVQFVPAKAYQNNISPQRLFSHLSLGKQMIKAFDEQAEKPAVLVVAFPPISTAFYAIQWAKKNKIPVVIDIIDPWPDAFTEHSHGLKKKVINAFLSPLRMRTQQIFQQASMVTAISNQYLNWAKTYAPISKTACYYPAIQLDEMDRQLQLAAQSVQKTNAFQVIYAGSLGFS
jgi:UDP-N-acetylglucosamine:LPS N-acetylglucosamine transferase